MSKSRPYVVTLSIAGTTPEDEATAKTVVVNAISQSQATKHALAPHQPKVTDVHPATALELGKLIARGARLEDATGDPDLKEAPLDMTKVDGREGEAAE